MLDRLKKQKSGLRYYVANYENDQDSIITAKEWQMVNHIILLLEPFFVTKECSKNNGLLLSMMPHARSLTKFVNTKESSEEPSNVCKTLAENIGEACEIRFFTRVGNVFGRVGSGKFLSLAGRSISN